MKKTDFDLQADNGKSCRKFLLFYFNYGSATLDNDIKGLCFLFV